MPEVRLNDEILSRFAWRRISAGPEGSIFKAENRHGLWTLRLNHKAEGRIEVSLEGRLKKGPARLELRPVVLPKIKADHVLIHGQKMGGCKAFLLKRGVKAEFESHAWITLTYGKHTLHLSHPLKQKNLTSFTGRISNTSVEGLAARTLFEPAKGRQFVSMTVTISASSDSHALLVNWAEEQREDSLPVSIPQESGWNSWDYYRWTITEDEVCKNAEAIAADPVLRRHVRRIVIDDGWEHCYGEWEANHFFPTGMKKLAQNLRKMGFTPGLWFAPTIVEPHSRFAQLDPELLTPGVSGFPCLAFSCMERKGFLLDPTHPRVRDWWERLFRQYADYGYEYFKLDFMAWTVPARRFHSPNAVPGELMSYIVEPIRRAIGPKSRILGCNFNFDGGSGLVDDVRISSDIHACWRSVKGNAGSIAARFWAQGRLWNSDPDFMVCRGPETSKDPDLHRLKPLLPSVRPDDVNEEGINYMDSLVDLKVREAEVLLSLTIASGGAMNLSDNLSRLDKTGLSLLRKAVQAENGPAAIPIDLFRSELPAYWVQKMAGGMHRVLLVNWEDHSARLELNLAELNVPRERLRNFWTGESVSLKRGRLVAKLRPHSCLLVETR